MNVLIGDKKTWDDWGLKLQAVTISFPEVKTSQVDIPGADGILDLTSALGGVRYKNRELQMVFDVMGGPERWQAIMSAVGNYLHGRRLKVILDSDPSYYYLGRLSLESEKSDYLTNHLTITGDMDPYKYELLSSLEDWLWAPFSFVSGTIRSYKNLIVDESLTVLIPGARKEVIPIITADAPMEVEWRGQRYPVPPGETKLYAISLAEGENLMTFYGNGMVSVEYQGGML